MKILISFCSHSSFLLLLLLFGSEARDVKLRGVVKLNPPFIFNNNGLYNGFCIDLIDYISKIVEFDYDLYLSPDGKYGGEGHIDGLIGELYRNSADFAITDLTVTNERRRIVDFTHPFMRYEINALINRSNLGRIQTLEDLTHQTSVKFGLLREGAVHTFIRESNNPIIKKIYRNINESPNGYVYSHRGALLLVKTSKYAFLAESTFNEYIADKDCNFTVINGGNLIQREYAIALPKESPYLLKFNNAIKTLENMGKLNQLRNKYWRTNCLLNNAFVLKNKFLITSVLLLMQCFLI